MNNLLLIFLTMIFTLGILPSCANNSCSKDYVSDWNEIHNSESSKEFVDSLNTKCKEFKSKHGAQICRAAVSNLEKDVSYADLKNRCDNIAKKATN